MGRVYFLLGQSVVACDSGSDCQSLSPGSEDRFKHFRPYSKAQKNILLMNRFFQQFFTIKEFNSAKYLVNLIDFYKIVTQLVFVSFWHSIEFYCQSMPERT